MAESNKGRGIDHIVRSSTSPPYVANQRIARVPLDDWEDTEAVNIVKTVFMECGAEYRSDGPKHLKVVGETEFVREAAIASRGSGKADCKCCTH